MKRSIKAAVKNYKLLAIVVVLVVLGGVVVASLLNKPQKSITELQDAMQDSVTLRYQNIAVSTDPWTGRYEQGSPVSIEGYAFGIIRPGSAGYRFTAKNSQSQSNDNTGSLQDVASYLNDMFKANGFGGGNEQTSDALKNYQWERGSERCSVAYIENQSVTGLCYEGANDPYKAHAVMAAPFVEAYAKAANIEQAKVTIGPLLIKSMNPYGYYGASKDRLYDIAEAVIKLSDESKGFVALFYKKEGAWNFVAKSVDESSIACDQIEMNSDARAALIGQPCYDGVSGQTIREVK